MNGSDLRGLLCADRLVQNSRKADQVATDFEAAKEFVPAVQIECVHRRPHPTDDKINEAFKRATGC